MNEDQALLWFPKGEGNVALLDPETGRYAKIGDLHRQASMLLKEYGIKRVDNRPGRSGRISYRTLRARGTQLHTICRDMREALPELRALSSLKPKHIARLIEHWRERGLAPKTMEVNMSMLRILGRWIGKPDLVGRTDRHLTADERKEARAPRVRAWTALGVDPESAIFNLCHEDPATGWMLWLCLRLGLRVREAMLLNPRMRTAGHLPITRGPKNGRTRTIPLTPADNELLHRFEIWLDRTGHDGCLIPYDMTEARYRSGYYYRLRRYGITKRGLGVTSHGLRHEYAQRLAANLEREFGVGDGIKMVHGTAVPRMSDGVALEISSRLGHARPSITYQYMGRPIDPASGDRRSQETI